MDEASLRRLQELELERLNHAMLPPQLLFRDPAPAPEILFRNDPDDFDDDPQDDEDEDRYRGDDLPKHALQIPRSGKIPPLHGMCWSCSWMYPTEHMPYQKNGYLICLHCFPRISQCQLCGEAGSVDTYVPGRQHNEACTGCGNAKGKLVVKQQMMFKPKSTILKNRREKLWAPTTSSEPTQNLF